MFSKRKGKSQGTGCLILFGLPFAAVGLYMAWSLMATLWLAMQVQSWEEVPATITSTNLEVHRGEDSDSYEVTAKYQYDFDGKQYTGERVSLATKFESDKYDRRKHKEFKQLVANKQPTICYVNPNRPDKSMLDRELRAPVVLMHLPFAICFTGVGLGLPIGGIWFLRQDKKRQKKLAQHPDEPWRVRDDWAAGVIHPANTWGTAIMGIFALFWNGLSVPIFLMVLYEPPKPWFVVWLVGLFPLIGLFLIYAFLKGLVNSGRVRKSTLKLANIPGVVGGQLAGVVLIPDAMRRREGYRATLVCRKKITRRDSDGDTSTSLKPIWEDAHTIEKTLSDSSGMRGVPVQFTIPSDVKPTDTEAETPIEWQLKLKALGDGKKFQAEFDVPVYRTADSQEGITTESAPPPQFARQDTLAEMLREEKIELQESGSGNGLTLRFSPGRFSGMAIGFSVAAAFLLGGAVAANFYAEGIFRWIMTGACGLIGMLFGFAALEQWLGFTDLAINGDDWRAISGWTGFGRREHAFTSDQIDRVYRKESMSSTNAGQETKVWNHLFVKLTGGKRIKVANNIGNRRVEQALVKLLRDRAGLTTAAETEPDDQTDDNDEFLEVPIE